MGSHHLLQILRRTGLHIRSALRTGVNARRFGIGKSASAGGPTGTPMGFGYVAEDLVFVEASAGPGRFVARLACVFPAHCSLGRLTFWLADFKTSCFLLL